MAKLIYSVTRWYQRTLQKSVFNNRTSYFAVRCISDEINEELNTAAKDQVHNDKMIKQTVVGKVKTIHMLQKLLKLNQTNAIEIAAKHKNLWNVSHLLNRNYKSCVANNLRNNVIIQIVDILGYDDLENRITILKELNEDLNNMAGLLLLEPNKLNVIVKHFKVNGNTVVLFSKLLKTSTFHLSVEFGKKSFLYRMNEMDVQQKIEILNKYGVSNNDIAGDLVVLRYSLETIKERIDNAIVNGVDEIKTWMIRANADIFNNYMRIRFENKSILGDKSVAEYLSQRLNCSLALASYLVSKLPVLNNKSVKKIDEVINYLYEEGIEPAQIYRVPKILLHSIDTTKKRLCLLKEQGYQIKSLYILIRSQRYFEEFLQNLVLSNEKEKNVQ